MGAIVNFKSNGGTAQGYLALPGGGNGPGVLVIQEWWGLVPHIRDVCDRLASEGFVALAPDLYHGESATEPDGAGKLMMGLNLAEAGKDLSGAVDELVARGGREHIGVVGFCMGGALALVVACQRPDAVAAVAPFYGVIGWPGAQPDWSALAAPVRGHYAELDDFASPAAVGELAERLTALGKDASFTIHPGTQHAFFNDTRQDVYDAAAAADAWTATVAFLHDTL